MAWFGKRQSTLDRRLREIDKQLEDLDAQVRRLQRSPARNSPFKPAHTVYPSNRQPPAGTAPPVASPATPPDAPPPDHGNVSFGAPRQRELWPRPAHEEPSEPPIRGWKMWLRSFFQTRQRPADPKLVSYLSTGSFKTVRPLRYERRMSRYRFVFSFALLVGTLLVVILALKNC
ncbi:MAG: hypothetical protein HZC54_01240 [Verrucomicrobia bacterium]|nr:hypothetical protein [Verrucomicrobiota bacterium]